MRHFFALLRHEIRALLIAPATYIAGVLALTILGLLFFWTLLMLVQSEQRVPPAEIFFGFFWVPVLLVVPMLTMRSLAEERRLGTLETLMTTPVRAWAVVLSKFGAAYAFYCGVWALSLAYPVLATVILDRPDLTARLLDPSALVGGYLFICITGTLFVAVGIFASSLTRSLLVSGMLSFSILFLLIVGVTVLGYLNLGLGQVQRLPAELVDYWQVFDHYQDFVRGMIDTRPVVYYGSGTLLVLGLATLVVESKA